MTARTKATALAMVIFAVGVLLGGLLTVRLVQVDFAGPPPPGSAERPGSRQVGVPEALMEDLAKRLDLDASQQEQLHELLRRSREEMVRVNREANREQRRLGRQTREDIRKILTPEQAQQFETFLSQVDQRRQGNNRRGTVQKGGNP